MGACLLHSYWSYNNVWHVEEIPLSPRDSSSLFVLFSPVSYLFANACRPFRCPEYIDFFSIWVLYPMIIYSWTHHLPISSRPICPLLFSLPLLGSGRVHANIWHCGHTSPVKLIIIRQLDIYGDIELGGTSRKLGRCHVFVSLSPHPESPEM